MMLLFFYNSSYKLQIGQQWGEEFQFGKKKKINEAVTGEMICQSFNSFIIILCQVTHLTDTLTFF
jgi:hypothetical protein